MCITVTSRVLLCSHCSPPRAAVSSWAPMEFTEDQSFVVAPALSLTAGRRNFPTTGLAARLTHCHRNKKGVLPGLFESLRTKSLADRKSFGTQHLGPNLGHMCNYKSSKWAIQVGQKWFPLFDKCVCIIYGWFSIAMIDSGTPTSQLAWSTGSSATEISSSPGNPWDYRRNDLDLWWCSWIFHVYDM